MAVKFPLEMNDGFKVRNLPELKEHFDVEKILGYFIDGKLKNWLDARYYEEEAEAISALDKNDPSLPKKLCDVFGVIYNEELNFDPEAIVRKNERIAKLKQFTTDCEIINQIDCVAFDQEELAELFDQDVKRIYLCEGEFSIPKSKQNLEYVILGNARAKGYKSNFDISDISSNEAAISEVKASHYIENDNDIPIELANAIGINNYCITDDYVVYEQVHCSAPVLFKEGKPFEFSDRKLLYDETFLIEDEKAKSNNSYLNIYHKRSGVIGSIKNDLFKKYGTLVGAYGNSIILKPTFSTENPDILVYDVDKKCAKYACADWSIFDRNSLSVCGDKIAYADNKKNIKIYNLETDSTDFIDTDAEEILTINSSHLFYLKGRSGNDIRKNKLVWYSLDNGNKECMVIDGVADIEHLFANERYLFIIGNYSNASFNAATAISRLTDRNSVFKVLAIDLKTRKINELFSSTKIVHGIFRSEHNFTECKRPSSYTFLDAESGFSVYSLDLIENKFGKIYENCDSNENHWDFTCAINRVGKYLFCTSSCLGYQGRRYRVDISTGGKVYEK